MTQQQEAIKEAKTAHKGENRETGEAFYFHPKRVFDILKDHGADDLSLIAGLLHDTVEHKKLRLPYIHKHYGIEVSYIVDALTRRRNELAKDSWGRLKSMAKADIRIIIVKLADRIDNIRTLNCFSIEKQKSYIEETEWMIDNIFGDHPFSKPLILTLKNALQIYV